MRRRPGKRNPTSAPSGADGDTLEKILTELTGMKDELKVVKGVLDKVDNRQRQQSKELKDVKDVLGKAEAEAREVALPAHPGHTPADVALWLQQALPLLLEARPKGKGKPSWLQACDGLMAYAEAAASLHQLAFLAQEERGELALLLLGAAATGELVECLEMGGEPVLRVTKEGLHLDLLEVKADAGATRNAVRQLQRQANILLLALALSNAAALEHGPLHVVATVEVAGAVPKPQRVKYWESRQLSVGGVGPAPQVPMRLRIRH